MSMSQLVKMVIIDKKIMTTYWKVTYKPEVNFIPGYCTNDVSHIAAYVPAMFTNDPECIVYVMEFDVDINRLVEVDYPPGGFNQDKKIKPGYFGPPDINGVHSTNTKDSLEIIVWNEPVFAKLVGAYVKKLTVDNSPSEYYIEDSNFTRDSKNGNWTVDDLKISGAAKSIAALFRSYG